MNITSLGVRNITAKVFPLFCTMNFKLGGDAVAAAGAAALVANPPQACGAGIRVSLGSAGRIVVLGGSPSARLGQGVRSNASEWVSRLIRTGLVFLVGGISKTWPNPCTRLRGLSSKPSDC